MAEKKGKYLTIGSLLKDKEGGLYIQVDKKLEGSVTLTKGQTLSLRDPRKSNQFLAEKGYISQEEAETRNSKIPDYVRYNVIVKV